jgi:rare lipoprotein A
MASMNLRSVVAGAVVFALSLLVLHTLPLQAEETVADSAEQTVATETRNTGVEGIASYYARYFKGRKTTSGVRYDPEKLTAAHSSLPLGTKVRVANLSNDKEVVVTINDRCRKRNRPFIDLSRAAARKLGFLGKGTARVTIARLEEETDS